MEDQLIVPIMWQVVFLLLIYFFSTAQSAIDNISEAGVRRLAGDGDKRAKRIVAIIDKPYHFLSGIRTGMMMCGYLASAFAVSNFLHRFLRWVNAFKLPIAADFLQLIGLFLIAVVLAFLMVVFGEFIPKRLAMRNPMKTALALSTPITVVTAIMKPYSWLATRTSYLILRLFGVKPVPDEQVTEDSIRQLVDIGEESGAIDSTEREMIENVFEFNDYTADEVMTHRKDIVALRLNDSDETLTELILQSGKSRYPVYAKDIDDIVGILNARDFLIDRAAHKNTAIFHLMRKPFFAPENLTADALFREMQHKKQHFAVVVDDYGGTSGVITMEDLIEQILGNIYDEYDSVELEDVQELGDGGYRIAGSADLEDVAALLGIKLPFEEYTTFSGYIFALLGTVPEDNTTHAIRTSDLEIQVEGIENHMVTTAIAHFINKSEEQE